MHIKFDSLDETDWFIERHRLPKLIQEEVVTQTAYIY